MSPEEISRLAEQEREKKRSENISSGSPAFNPFDWLEFKRTRNWIAKNLKLSNSFYSLLMWCLMLFVLTLYFFLQDQELWAFYSMLCLGAINIVLIVGGFIYGYYFNKKEKNK